MPFDQALKGGFPESQQYGVTKRRYGRRAPSASKQPHLAYYLTSLAARYKHFMAVAAANGDTHASRDDNVERIGHLILAKKSGAAGYAQPFEFGFEGDK
jgi:hypothetical protein